MTPEEFRKVLSERPFRRFSLYMPDGSEIEVRHPESADLRGRIVEITRSEGRFDLVDLMLVARVTGLRTETDIP